VSNNLLRLIPTDPYYVPDDQAQQQARDLFATLVPQAQEVRLKVTDAPALYDAGANMETIVCPACGTVLDDQRWMKEMDRAYNDGKFTDLTISTPCCDTLCSLNELVYDWPMGFACFVLEAVSPLTDIGDRQQDLLEQILQCKLRKIWALY
jgi:hypothetical protein